MKNKQIREHAIEKGVRLWQVAEELKIADCKFSRMLRHELPDTEREQILTIIDKIAEREAV